jgi:hypothetical protein
MSNRECHDGREIKHISQCVREVAAATVTSIERSTVDTLDVEAFGPILNDPCACHIEAAAFLLVIPMSKAGRNGDMYREVAHALIARLEESESP